MSMLENITNVLTFAAFRPDPDDPNTTWSKRYSGRRSLLLNVSRARTVWRALSKRGRLLEGGSDDGELADIAKSHAAEWRGLSDGGWCAVSLNNRFIISLENNLSRRENTVELLRTNPKAVLGTKYDRGKRYAVYHHPTATSSILMACDDAYVKLAEDAVRSNGLRIGRVCCGLFALMEKRLGEIYASGKPEAQGSFMLIVTCDGSIAVLVQHEGQWSDLRCRSGVGTDGVDPMIQIINPLVQKIQPGTPVFYVHDGIDPQFAADMMKQLHELGAQNATEENALWKIIGVN